MNKDQELAAHPGHKKPIEIFVNNKPFHTEARDLTGLAIKELADVPPDYDLYREKSVIPNDATVELHEKEHFRAIPAGTFGVS